MSRKVQRVKYHLDSKGIRSLSRDEIKAILRGADDLIMRGGRTLLAKVLKGSRAKDLLNTGLNRSPVYGYYRNLPEGDILSRIDWVILNGYLAIRYDYRLPLLVYTPQGWEIEKGTFADELLRGFDEMLATGSRPFSMGYLKDKPRDLIWLLLDKVEATGDAKYIPLLDAWEHVDYKKVRQRIRQVINRLNQAAT
jgi:hypothetical protein